MPSYHLKMTYKQQTNSNTQRNRQTTVNLFRFTVSCGHEFTVSNIHFFHHLIFPLVHHRSPLLIYCSYIHCFIPLYSQFHPFTTTHSNTATVTHSLVTSSIPSSASLYSPTHQLAYILRLNWLAFSSPPSLDLDF